MIRTGTRSAAARCARHLAVAAAPAAVVALAVLPPSPASAADGWSAPVIIDPNGTATAVSCPGTTFCMAVGNQPGNQGYAVSWDGSAWSARRSWTRTASCCRCRARRPAFAWRRTTTGTS